VQVLQVACPANVSPWLPTQAPPSLPFNRMGDPSPILLPLRNRQPLFPGDQEHRVTLQPSLQRSLSLLLTQPGLVQLLQGM
jgi:hypothetical protein